MNNDITHCGGALPPVDIADLTVGLNPEQLSAVTARNSGSLLVLAGAGCGKTAVLTRRIAFLARFGISPARICALTFSRKAAEEMAHRLVKLDSSCGGENAPTVTTFHAFALKVLKEETAGRRNFDRLGFSGGAVLMEARERIEMLSRVSSAQARKTLRMSVTDLDAALELLSSFPERAVEKWGEADAKLLMKIESDFSAARRDAGLWDFSDLIGGCLELFKKFPDVAAVYAKRYDVILVDEFQDTNPMQIDLLDMLLGNSEGGASATLYAVGDDDQAIYGFRGADIRPIMNFTSRFKDARIIKLQINYRSVESILNCANKLWVDKRPEYRKTLVSGLTDPPAGCRKPRALRFRTQAQALDWIMKKADSISREANIPVCEMALLFRLNETLSSASDYLKTLESSAGRDAAHPQIKMLTVHASKGLEYPVVFLCDLEEGVFPHYRMRKERGINSWADFFKALVSPKKADAPGCDLGEELRLFYVGVTRARRFLFFITASKKPVYGRMMNFAPSRFLRLAR